MPDNVEASATQPQAAERESLAERFPIDVTQYSLKGEELEFMQAQTGIMDEEELKKHILAVQAEAYAVSKSPLLYIASELFTRLADLSVPMYPSLYLPQVSFSCFGRHLGLQSV